MAKLTNLQKLSADIIAGKVEKYSTKEADEVLRKAMLEAMGVQEWDVYAFEDNKYKVFKILSETLSVGLAEKIQSKYTDWVEFKNIPLGDTVNFMTLPNDLFKVGYIGLGNTNVRRQKMVNGKLQGTKFGLFVKIYEEFQMYLAGRINWSDMIERIYSSFDNEIASMIIRAVENSYTGLDSKFVLSGSFDEEKVLDLIARLEAKTGYKVTVYGTKKALRKLPIVSEGDKETISKQGYLGNFRGTPVVELAQCLDANNDFVLASDMLFFIPQGDFKIVQLVMEGEAYIKESANERLDMQMEYLFMQYFQLGVCKTSYYGVMHSIV